MRKIKIATSKKQTDCNKSSSENPREQALFAAPLPFGGKISLAAVYAGGPGERSYFDFADVVQLTYLLFKPPVLLIFVKVPNSIWGGLSSMV